MSENFDFWATLHQNKTSVEWTPGSQIYRSNQKIIFGEKNNKENAKIMHNLCPIMLATNTISIDSKASSEISVSSLEEVLRKGRKSAENALILHNYAN